MARATGRLSAIGLLLLAALWLAAPAGVAQEAPAAPAAEAEAPPAEAEAPAAEAEAPAFDAALTDPATDIDEFGLRLIPLTADDLAALAEIWRGILKAENEAVVEAQIAVGRAEGEAADAARTRLEALQEERRALFARYNLVVSAWEKKGGAAEAIADYQAYRNAVLIEETRTAGWRALAARAASWFTERDGGIEFGIRTAVILVSLFALFTVARVVRRIAGRAVGRIPNLSKLLQAFVVVVIYWLTIAFGLMIVLSALGVDITPVFALIGGASFIMAFALQDTLGNLAAGLMIMINRPFDEGDFVDIGGVAGTVKAVSIVSTTVTTPDNQVIVVPNSKVWGNVITNVTASAVRRVDLVFGISYDDAIEAAQAVLERVVLAHPLVLREPEPVIRVNALSASSVDFVVRPWAKSADYWTVYWDLTRQVKEAFDAAGISIPFPQQDLNVRVPGGGGAGHPALARAAATGRPAGAPDFATGDAGHDDEDEDAR
jgi:small conductance mechanosensitive channel